jgi:septin family protein
MKKNKNSKKSIDCLITDFSSILNDGEDDMPSYRQRHFLMPNKTFRMLLVGPSGCGKSNLLMNFLLKFLHYDKLYVYTRHMEQDCYKKLKRVLENVENETGEEILTIDNDPNNIVSPEDLDTQMQNLIVFDDLVLADKSIQRKITEMFVRGRHENCSCIYISQMYHKIPRDIRLNATHLCIFDVCNKREMSLLATELNNSMSRDDFINMYNMCTQDPYDFMYIDRENKHFPFRRNLDDFYAPNIL